MWSVHTILCVCYGISVVLALPAAKNEAEKVVLKPEPIILEAFELPSNEKPANEKPIDSKPIDLIAIDLKPINSPEPAAIKPTEGSKPSEFGTAFPMIQAAGGKPPRRQFFYDQRQDGKYNIRADLENFVILVVPSSGNSLLDLLKRSNQRNQHTKRTHTGKHHKKYASGPAVGAGKMADTAAKKSSTRLDYLKPEESEHESVSAGEFIEGRTPYHVDISSAEILQPTPYGSNGVRTLDAESAVTTSDIESNGDVDFAYGTAETTGKGKNQGIFIVPEPTTNTNTINTHPRLSKSLTVDGYGNSNFVLLTRKSQRNDFGDSAQQSDVESLNRNNYNNYYSHRPSVQIVNRAANNVNDASIDLTDMNNSFNSLNALSGDDGTTKSVSELANAQWELTLLGAEEQCGPDRRRDSYGICQFVPADYATT